GQFDTLAGGGRLLRPSQDVVEPGVQYREPLALPLELPRLLAPRVRRRQQFAGLLQRCDGLDKPGLLHQRAAEVVVRQPEVVLKGYGRAKRGLGLAEFPLLYQDPAQVVLNIRGVWFDANRLAVGRLGPDEVALRTQGVAEVVPRVGESRFESGELAESRLGF